MQSLQAVTFPLPGESQELPRLDVAMLAESFMRSAFESLHWQLHEGALVEQFAEGRGGVWRMPVQRDSELDILRWSIVPLGPRT